MIMYFSCNNRGYYVWQKSHQSQLIRFDLRTKDFHTASIRSKVLLSTYYRLKRESLKIQDIREYLIAERDRYIEHEVHVQAAHLIPWGRSDTGSISPELSVRRQQGHKISAVAEEWYEDMSGDWRPLTFKGNKAAADFFISWYGDNDIESVNKVTVTKFKKALATKYPSEMSRQSMFKKVTALFNFATEKRDYLPKNPFGGMGYRKPKNLRTKHPVPLKLHQEALLKVEHESSLWWLLQILYYTGMRLSEVLQLTVEDYVIIADKGKFIDCISVNDRNGKRVKNTSSFRTIPVHHELMTLGIMEKKPTFPWKVHNPASNAVSKLFHSLNEKHSPHVYRYGMSDRLRDLPELPDHVRFSILGHSSNTVTDKIYRGKEPILLMKEAIDRT
ncbi:tyrosine-type recombinase/integrase [Leclercia adecarboxylata]|uniref:tyrosine-type recombinase/integrase n=1 Tax=Leclercia adecarboxylata TaxID=83655 RepID=UPI0013DFD9C2|nr:tyrosine-type recombinase/integrase [Leclercia adecarboxylata]